MGRGSSMIGVAGLPFLTRGEGKFYFEVEACEATGALFVGLVGTSFGGEYVGADEASWGIGNDEFDHHRSDPPPSSAHGP